MSVLESPVDLAPHQLSLVLPATPVSVGAARRETAKGLGSWEVQLDMDVFALLLSELVTNAVRHAVAPGRADTSTINVAVYETASGVYVEVHDPDEGENRGLALRRAPEHSESGRGLALVDALATDWGCRKTEAGKCVFFLLGDLDDAVPGAVQEPADAASPAPGATELAWVGEWW